jgi:hypothetical protein
MVDVQREAAVGEVVRKLVPSLAWFSPRSLSTDLLENLFGRLAQMLHYKPRMRDVIRMLSKLEALAHLGALANQLFSFPDPAKHKRHYDRVTLESFCSGDADSVDSMMRVRHQTQLRATARRIANVFVPVRAHHAPPR